MEVTYIDHMGDDLRVVNAARVSFNKESQLEEVLKEGEYGSVETLVEQDVKLIKYLSTHNHWTPFSHCMVTLREKVPIFVARQRFKHMVGFSYNEVSRRYVDDEPEFFVPDKWRSRPDGSVKQGSGKKEVKEMLFHGTVESWTGEVEGFYYQHLDSCRAIYESMLKAGVAPEQARMVLPQSMYTEYYVTGSLAAWARAYKLRIDTHAQKEIQDLAKIWGDVIQPLFPVSWSALTNAGQSEALIKEKESNDKR